MILTSIPVLGDLGLGNKRLVTLLCLPVRQDLKIQLEWER